MAKQTTSDFTVNECVTFGWETTKKNIGFLFVLQLIWIGIYAAGAIVNALAQFTKLGFTHFLTSIVVYAVQIVVGIGGIAIAIKYADGKKVEYKDVIGDINLFWKYLGGAILYALIVLGGLILLIVPGVIWAIKYQFWSYLIVDKKMGPVEAIKQSGKMTANRKGTLFMLGLTSIGIAILGFLALVVGLFWACPTIFIAGGYAYRKLEKMTK